MIQDKHSFRIFNDEAVTLIDGILFERKPFVTKDQTIDLWCRREYSVQTLCRNFAERQRVPIQMELHTIDESQIQWLNKASRTRGVNLAEYRTSRGHKLIHKKKVRVNQDMTVIPSVRRSTTP